MLWLYQCVPSEYLPLHPLPEIWKSGVEPLSSVRTLDKASLGTEAGIGQGGERMVGEGWMTD